MSHRSVQAYTDIHSIRPCPSGLHRSALSLICQAIPQSLPGQRFTHTQSPFCCATHPRPAQAGTISTLLGHAPKACQAMSHRHSQYLPVHALGHSQASMISTGLHPSHLHRSAQPLPGYTLRPAQTSTISTGLHTSHLHRPGRCPPGPCP
jgi:hypothetical protein